MWASAHQQHWDCAHPQTRERRGNLRRSPPPDWVLWQGAPGFPLLLALPSTEMFNEGRAFAIVFLPFCGHKNICALAPIPKIPRLLVGACYRYLCMYNLDPQKGAMPSNKAKQIGWQFGDNQWKLRLHLSRLPLRTQMYSTTVAKVPRVPASPTRPPPTQRSCVHWAALVWKRKPAGTCSWNRRASILPQFFRVTELDLWNLSSEKNTAWQRTLCYASINFDLSCVKGRQRQK